MRGMEEAITSPLHPVVLETEKSLSLPDDETTTRLRNLAKQFADQVPEGDFSPADLQDYLLIHKKDPEKAVIEVKAWMEKVYQERKKKDEEQEGQKEARREEKKRERDRFQEEVKKAVRGLSTSEDEGGKDAKGVEEKEGKGIEEAKGA